MMRSAKVIERRKRGGYVFFYMISKSEVMIGDDKANIRSISYRDGEFIVRELKHLNSRTQEVLPGVYCKGIQYYDLRGIGSINNTGLASLIDLMRSLLKNGVETQFVNANESVRSRIHALGLDEVLKCI